MFKLIQELLSKRFKNFAPFSVQELNGIKSGILYSRKGKINNIFDFYYIKHNLVYSVNYYYCNNANHRKKLQSIVTISENKKRISPKEYLLITKYYDLTPDYATYLDVVIEWMCYKGYVFYEDILLSDLPQKLPAGFERIISDIHEKTYFFLKNGNAANSGTIYADLYVINGMVCLITGKGKTDACKSIAEKCVAYDFVEFKDNEEFGLTCKGRSDTDYLTVDYCVHMDSINFDSIREIVLYEYLQKARGNITRYNTSLPTFYHIIKHRKCKMVVLPYSDTIEIKTNILKNYLNDVTKNKHSSG